jgi:membrane-associated phospholipid phosphatase
MKNITDKQKNVFILFILLLVFYIYFLLNIPHESVYILRTSLDDHIPRIPIFSIPYLAFFPFLFGAVFYSWFKNKLFRQLALSIIIVCSIAFSVFVFFQTYVPREPITSNDLFSRLLQFIYSHDQPYNGFPSLHAALSTVVAVYFVCSKSKWAWAFVTMAAIIIISTLFTKQHFIADAISGVTLGLVVTWVVFLNISQRKIPSYFKD